MGDYSDKIAASVASSLSPDEQVVAATPAAPRGMMQSMARGDGPRPRASTNRLADGRTQLAAIGVPFAPQYVLVCTTERLVWFRTSVLGRPKGFAGSVARGDVDHIALAEDRVLHQPFGVLQLALRNGSHCELEVARVHLRRAEDFVERANGDASNAA